MSTEREPTLHSQVDDPGRFNCQKFMHAFDWYAKPVTLTYNQQKEFKTIPGGICSIISFFILGFYIISNFVKYVDPDYFVFFHTNSRRLINIETPPLFNIEMT